MENNSDLTTAIHGISLSLRYPRKNPGPWWLLSISHLRSSSYPNPWGNAFRGTLKYASKPAGSGPGRPADRSRPLPLSLGRRGSLSNRSLLSPFRRGGPHGESRGPSSRWRGPGRAPGSDLRRYGRGPGRRDESDVPLLSPQSVLGRSPPPRSFGGGCTCSSSRRSTKFRWQHYCPRVPPVRVYTNRRSESALDVVLGESAWTFVFNRGPG